MKRQDGSGFFDRFRGRLMFPIHNESGKVIAFGGRALRAGDEPKYLNSPETPLYRKSYVLYNLHRAKDAVRKSDFAVLVEGYMDVIGVYSAGVRNVVASCGTALTNTQVRALKRHSERIVVNFDPDAAGANAAERSIQMLLDENLQVRVLELEEDLDPDEYVKHAGADAYRGRLEKRPRIFTGWPIARANVSTCARWKAACRASSSSRPPSSASPIAWSASRSPTTWRIIWASTRSWFATTSARAPPIARPPVAARQFPPSNGCCSILCWSSEKARMEAIPQLRT